MIASVSSTVGRPTRAPRAKQLVFEGVDGSQPLVFVVGGLVDGKLELISIVMFRHSLDVHVLVQTFLSSFIVHLHIWSRSIKV